MLLSLRIILDYNFLVTPSQLLFFDIAFALCLGYKFCSTFIILILLLLFSPNENIQGIYLWYFLRKFLNIFQYYASKKIQETPPQNLEKNVIPEIKISSFGYLCFHIGPMYSGKTTGMWSDLQHFSLDERVKICYINTSEDIRDEGVLTSHNPLLQRRLFSSRIEMASFKTLYEARSFIENFDVIGIDESHYWNDLLDEVLYWLVRGKIIVVAGLNGSSECDQIGQNLQLIPHVDDLHYHHGICRYCLKENDTCVSRYPPASFTARLVSSKSVLLNGGKDEYMSTCRRHHNQYNIPVTKLA